MRILSQRSTHSLAVLLSFMLFGTALAAADNYTFTVVAATGDQFAILGKDPAINCHGDVLFAAGSAEHSSLYVARGQEISPIHEIAAAPKKYVRPQINDVGTIAFGVLPESSVIPSTSIPRIIRGTPGALTDVTNDRHRGVTPTLNNRGHVAYSGSTHELSGVFVDSGRQITVIREARSPFRYLPRGKIAMNDNGNLAFGYELDDGTIGILMANGVNSEIIVDSEQITGADHFATPAMNNSGALAFSAIVGLEQRIYKSDESGLSLLADTAGPFAGFRHEVSINENGDVVFLAHLSWEPEISGVFTGGDPKADKVTVTGDEIAGSTISTSSIGQSALNGRGQIVFRASLADGRQAIVVASPTSGGNAKCAPEHESHTLRAEISPHPYEVLAAKIGPSRWIEAERKRYESLLQSTGADTLIIPFQAKGHTLDAIGRSMLARLLAASLKQSTGERIPDVGWVEKALGEPARNVPMREVISLGRKMGVKRIIQGTVEHDREFNLSVDMQIWEDEAGEVAADSKTYKLSWTDVPFSDTKLPFMAFAPIATEAIETITTSSRHTKKISKDAVASGVVPDTYDALVRQAGSSRADTAMMLEFVGHLFPSRSSVRSREHLFERALVSLGGLAPASADFRLLNARALLALHRRPAALAALGEPTTPAEQALLAYMDADLPRLQSQLTEIKRPILKLMAEFDLQEMRFAYDRAAQRDLAEAYFNINPNWAGFITRRLLDGDPWGNFANVWTKQAIDRLVPSGNQSLERLMEGRRAQGLYADELEIAKAVLADVEAGFGKPPRQDAQIHHTDILELAVANTLANAIAASRTEQYSRARYDKALEIVQSYEAIFADHPLLVLAKADAIRFPGGAPMREIRRLQDEVDRLTRSGVVWLGQQHEEMFRIHAEPHKLFPELIELSKDAQDEAIYTHDFPRRVTHHYGRKPDEALENALQCLRYTVYQIQCATQLLQFIDAGNTQNDELVSNLSAQLNRRFNGHPDRDDALLALAHIKGDAVSPATFYKQAVDAGSLDWEAYFTVGWDLVKNGDYSAARETFLRYPGFAQPGLIDSVQLSNFAYNAGSTLYWVGAVEDAKLLYRIAAELRTGSNASLSSAARLNLLDGNLAEAADIFLARARRYKSGYAYRDHIALLHLLGESERAWALFDGIFGQVGGSVKWSGAYAGHRLAGASSSEIVEWATAPMRRRQKHTTFESAAGRYVFLMHVVDRIPTRDFPALIRRFEPRAAGKVVYLEHVDPDTGEEFRLLHDHALIDFTAKGIHYFLNGDMKSAYEAFDQISPIQRMREFVPYYAYASKSIGKTERIDEYLESAPARDMEASMGDDPRIMRFYDRLARAYLIGLDGQHQAALSEIRLAFNDRPFTDFQAMFPDYQLIETAERLYEATGEDEYRALGFDMARRLQIVEPMYAWVYAFAAKLAETDQERMPYLATALHLDRHSVRVSQFGAREHSAAQEWLKTNGPMYQRRQSREEIDVVANRLCRDAESGEMLGVRISLP